LTNKNKLRINKEIRVSEARVIDQEGKMIGVIPISKALEMAFEAGLDLIEVSPNANPVVCRIASFSKLKYEEQKKEAQNKKKQRVADTKEIKMSLNIGESDFNTKVKQSVKFLEKGDKVKFNFVFRGREITYSDSAKAIIEKIEETLKEIGKMEERPKMEGKKLFFTIVPLK
jgi:translation initiation factor IF-3